jgi:O-antigen/teichoic acid export membrane protein
MWLAALAGVAYTSADRIIVGRSLGAAAAGQYNIYVQITQLIHFVPSSLFAFSFPAFSRLAAQGSAQWDEIARVYRTNLLAIGTTALGISAAMMLSWTFLLRVFSGGLPGGDQGGLSALLGANFLLLAASVVPYYLLLALGRSRTVSLTTSTSMLAALALMVVLVPRYGLQGAALARLAYGIGALMLLRSAHRVLKRT